MPAQVYVPDPPIYDRSTEMGEYDEQQVARVELLMLKGIRSRRQLQALLDIHDARTMDRYMRRVHARWEVFGTTRDYARHRGEGLARLDLIESEIWSKLSNLDEKASPQVSLNYLNALLKVQEYRADTLGLTPKVIAHIGNTDDMGSDFSRMVLKHDRLSQLVQRMHEMIEERSKVIDHEPDEKA